MDRGEQRKFLPVVAVAVLAVLVLVSAGCLRRSRPTRVFVLSAEALSPLPSASVLPAGVYIAAVSLPDYLNRWQLVRCQENNEIVIDWFSTWSELPELAVTAVLEQNLRALLGAGQVASRGESRRGRLGLGFVFSAFAADGHGTFRTAGLCREGERTVAEFALELPYQPGRPETLVAAHARALATVSRMVAESLRQPADREQTAP